MPAVLSSQPFSPCRILSPCALKAVTAQGVRRPWASTAQYSRNLLMQLGALKDAVRQMAEAKDAAAAQSVGPVQEQLQVPQGEL